MSSYHTKEYSGFRGQWTLYDLAGGSAFLCCAALSAACFAAALTIGVIGFFAAGNAALDGVGLMAGLCVGSTLTLAF